MFSNKDTSHISGFIPFRLPRHVVCNLSPIDHKIHKPDTKYLVILIIPCNDRQVFTRSIVSNILNKHILNTSAGRDTILRIETDSEIHKLSVTKIFNPNILERNITHQCIVAWIYSQTSLIINLVFCLIKNVDIPKSDVLHCIHAVRISCPPILIG